MGSSTVDVIGRGQSPPHDLLLQSSATLSPPDRARSVVTRDGLCVLEGIRKDVDVRSKVWEGSVCDDVAPCRASMESDFILCHSIYWRLCPPPASMPRVLQYTKSDDIWENGTVVRYMARIIAVLMAASAIFAYRDQLIGKSPARVNSARRDGGEQSSKVESESRKNR